MSSVRLSLLVVTHVEWEGPHRILDAFPDVPVVAARPLEGDELPEPDAVRGAVFMGGPMSVNDGLPGLDAEIAWLERALATEVPVFGVCLGAQLLARAIGGRVVSGAGPEIGWAPVEVHDPDDPVLGPLAPSATVLHWHGETIELPGGTRPLARSGPTAVQAFHHAPAAWGTLFHAEADAALVERWVAEPTMAEEAIDANGPDALERLRADGPAADDLTVRSARSFAAFADRCRARAEALGRSS